MSVLTALLLTLLFAACNGQWMTQYDQHFKIECPHQQIIKSIESQHDNKYEDRVWNMICAAAPNKTRIGACEWTGYVNNFDELMEYLCPEEKIIAGLESIHDSEHEDRKYSFKCCVPQGAVAHACENTPYVNDYDQHFNYRIRDGFALKGVNSVHDNNHEDRIFKFVLCKLTALSIEGK